MSAGGLLFGYERHTVESGSGGDRKFTTVGLLGSGFGAGLGVALTDTALLGVRTTFGKSTSEEAGHSTESSGFSIQPRFEAMAGDGSVMPYFVGTFGYRWLKSEMSKSSSFTFGAGFGLHCFPESNVSLDPELLAIRISGAGGTDSNEVQVSGWGAMLGITLSAWLGGRPAHPSAPRAGAAVASLPAMPRASDAATSDKPVGQTQNVAVTDLQGGVMVDTTVGPFPFASSVARENTGTSPARSSNSRVA